MAKVPLKSKTIWLGLLTSIVSVAAAKFPQAAEFVDEHWNVIGALLGGVIIVLRGLTKRPLQLISE